MIEATDLIELEHQINRNFLMPEQVVLTDLRCVLQAYTHEPVAHFAGQLISTVRAQTKQSLFETFLREFALNSAEGMVLLSMAEALLRIPDRRTQNLFIQEKLADADWQKHFVQSDSWLIKLATGGLYVGGLLESRIRDAQIKSVSSPGGMLAQLSQPLIRNAVKQAMQFLAQHFVLGETIQSALRLAGKQAVYRYSFDMLGEYALTEDDAERYFQAYAQAIASLSQNTDQAVLFENPGISVKLSALCPRFEATQYQFAIPRLQKRLLALATLARDANISLTVDAEEAERLHMSLTIFAAVFSEPAMASWPGLGLAVQAYQKRAPSVIRWLAALALKQQRRIPVRLVKGAYWDTEIKCAQELGWDDYPVFTRKSATDVSYLACARLLLSQTECFYPQFATHNALTVAAICQMAPRHAEFEFQRLHGMGDALYAVLRQHNPNYRCRIYAPVGYYRDLLPYLVRRLLENGANTSFIQQIENSAISVNELTCDPLLAVLKQDKPIALPGELFGKQRKNSQGLNLHDLQVLQALQQDVQYYTGYYWQAYPSTCTNFDKADLLPVYSPYDQNQCVGNVQYASAEQVEEALSVATRAFADWRLTPVEIRAGYLLKAADLLEQHRSELLALAIREAGRTLRDACAEIREAVDLCRYYAAMGQDLFSHTQTMPGPVGENNQLRYAGRGVFVCISPWNFPIAICIGQIAAALISGNTVLAKPAEQTCLTAMLCMRLLHSAGIPRSVLHFLPGEGAVLGRQLLSDLRVAGVAFTGSCATAALINQQLAKRVGGIAPLIAETGGLNVLIADTSAHVEQLVIDALQSAFNSAGQRCSSLRVLYLPQQTADHIIERLIGAMQLLRIGSPLEMSIDIGPIIDREALLELDAHLEKLRVGGKLRYQLCLPEGLERGCFFPPSLAEIPALSFLEQEVFGPILHIVRYDSRELPQIVAEVNASGYGLTLGVHSRVQSNITFIQQHARVGNVYINRNMIGAVVGVQPFGGQGLSGTGPKAGGPNYLLRFATEQTLTDNIAAIGGNPWLYR